MVLYFLFTEKALTSTSDMDLIESHISEVVVDLRVPQIFLEPTTIILGVLGVLLGVFPGFCWFLLLFLQCLHRVSVDFPPQNEAAPFLLVYYLWPPCICIYSQLGQGGIGSCPQHRQHPLNLQFPSLAKLFPFVESVLQLCSFVASKLGTQKE